MPPDSAPSHSTPGVPWRLNGQKAFGHPGTSLLEAIRKQGVELLTLCHDPRLRPASKCRFCEVEVEGEAKPLCACDTPLREGLQVHTHTPALEDFRKGMMRMLTAQWGREALRALDGKDFGRLYARYGDSEHLPERHPYESEQDPRHPYIRVDLSRCVHCDRCIRICDEIQGQGIWTASERGAQRRIVAEADRVLLESGCVSCGACVDTCPTGALEDRRAATLGPAEAWTRTLCSYCGTGCELEVGTRGSRIVAVHAVLDSPVSEGHLCVKGRFGTGFLEAPDRILHPMLRQSGEWIPASWEEALKAAAKGLQESLEEGGPASVGVLASSRSTNEASYLAGKFARLVLGTHNIDCCARVCHAPSAAGLGQAFGTGAATNSFQDIDRASLLLVAGANPTENHPVVGARIKRRVRAGIPLIVVDPRRTELAALATVHLALKPGTNVPLFNAMARVILEEGLEDAAFLAERTENLEAFRKSLAPWTPEAAAKVCGVDPEAIRRATRLYAFHRPALSLNGLGMTEQVQGTDSIRALAHLALLTGNIGKPGSGVNPLRGQNNVQGTANMGCEPGRLTGYAPLDAARGLHEAIWGQALPVERGLDAMTMIDAAGEGRLQALLLVGYDVLLSHPNAHNTEAALGRLRHLIVVDPFLNETARRYGTIFLPAATPFESEGTYMNGERRIQRLRRVLPPRGECREDRDILCTLAQHLGHPDGFRFASASEVWDEIRKVWPQGAGITYERLEAEGGLCWPCPHIHHPGTEILHVDGFSSGKRAGFHPIDYRPSGEVPSETYPFLLITGRVLAHFNAATMTARTQNLELAADDHLEIHPEDAKGLGIREGASVLVESGHGAFFAHAHLTDRVQPGQVFAAFHRPQALVNHATGKGRDPVTHTPEYKVTAVRITPKEPG